VRSDRHTLLTGQ
jgi:hypothetical protein